MKTVFKKIMGGGKLLLCSVVRIITPLGKTKIHTGETLDECFDNTAKVFLSKEKFQNKSFIKKLRKDAMYCYKKYLLTPDEYFLHRFYLKSTEERENILPRNFKDKICIDFLGKDWRIPFSQLKDKWSFYQMTSQYFKRDVCKIEDNSDYDDFEKFFNKHQRFIAKPRRKSCGIGVHVVDGINYNNDPKRVFDYMLGLEDLWMAEELIIQSKEMAIWNPSSVNTIRIPSIRTKNGCVVIAPLFRCGRDGNIVDNCHNNGGLMAIPDVKTGVLISQGCDVFGNFVEEHVNTHIKFKGWQVPHWNELIELSSEIHSSLPIQHKYVGFDFALTNHGWVLVEGNWGNFPHQCAMDHGIKKEFIKLMNS